MSFIRYVPQVLIPFNERAYTYVFEDYFSTTVPAWAIQSGSGGSILQSGGVTNNTNIGMIGLYTGTTTTGRMALMRTVSPPVFVAFKHWMAELDSRPPGKRRRDRLQADLVQQLLDEGALPP